MSSPNTTKNSLFSPVRTKRNTKAKFYINTKINAQKLHCDFKRKLKKYKFNESRLLSDWRSILNNFVL